MRGEGRLLKKQGSSIWWIACWAPAGDGTSREFREGTRTPDREEAEQHLKTRRAELANRAMGAPPVPVPGIDGLTVSEMLDSLESYSQSTARSRSGRRSPTCDISGMHSGTTGPPQSRATASGPTSPNA